MSKKPTKKLMKAAYKLTNAAHDYSTALVRCMDCGDYPTDEETERYERKFKQQQEILFQAALDFAKAKGEPK